MLPDHEDKPGVRQHVTGDAGHVGFIELAVQGEVVLDGEGRHRLEHARMARRLPELQRWNIRVVGFVEFLEQHARQLKSPVFPLAGKTTRAPQKKRRLPRPR